MKQRRRQKVCRSTQECLTQRKFYSAVDARWRPKNVQVIVLGRTIFYDDVVSPGTPLWQDVVAAAVSGLWGGPDDTTLPIDVRVYCDYVHDRAREVDVDVDRVLCRLRECDYDLTPVRVCHGDMTLENCLWTGDGVVFIDPGDPRSLPCRELDEAKILQSLDGWEDCFQHTHEMPTRPVHWALLVTHYVRLLRHDHPESRLEHARRRIREITEVLTWND